jgi:hypothetical protein
MSGKSKGGDFEREIARLLSLWWTGNHREDVFYRSHSSGARFTVRKKSGKDAALQGGDITASDPIGVPLIARWSIEIKTGYGKKISSGINRWDILDCIDSKQKATVLRKMWEQCCRDATLSYREPILIFRRNGRSPCIMIKTSYENTLRQWFSSVPGTSIYIELFDQCTIMSLQDFFEWIPDIRSSLKSYIKRK